MIRLKLNNEMHEIPKVSELNFRDFSRVMIDAEVSELSEYLSLWVDMDLTELMKAKFHGTSISAIYQQVFDVDIKKMLKTEFETVTHDGKTLIMKDIDIDTYGKHYFFSLYFEQYKAEKINLYQLSLFCLAIAIEEDQDMEKVAKIYKELQLRNWVEVLPQAFFLLKKFLKKKKDSWKVLLRYITELSAIKWRNRWQLKKLKFMEKKLLRNY